MKNSRDLITYIKKYNARKIQIVVNKYSRKIIKQIDEETLQVYVNSIRTATILKRNLQEAGIESVSIQPLNKRKIGDRKKDEPGNGTKTTIGKK